MHNRHHPPRAVTLECSRVSVAEFLMKNILLVAVAVASGTMLVWPYLMRLVHGTNEVSVNDAVRLINQKDALLIDVREPADYAAGHIPHARNVPASQIKERVKELEKFKSRPLIVHCRNGQRSSSATSALREAGFTEAVKLRDGLTAWEQANLPIQKGAKA
jgi:rhodanese-related sulfurtransferase